MKSIKIKHRHQLAKEVFKSGGFTLSEILVYIAVLSIVVLAVSSLLLWISRTNTKAQATREVLDNRRRLMETITHEIKEAQSIYTPTSLFADSLGQLSLETTKYLPLGETATFIDFYLCDTRLCLKKEDSDPVAITSERVEIVSLEFSQVATSSIQVNLQIDYKTEKEEYRSSINTTSTISLRAYQ